MFFLIIIFSKIVFFLKNSLVFLIIQRYSVLSKLSGASFYQYLTKKKIEYPLRSLERGLWVSPYHYS